MFDLTVIEKEGQLVTDSREVAEMIGKNHADLLRDIRTYKGYLSKSNFALANFFIESNYIDTQGKDRICYLLTKKGCDMVANKMTGTKGVLFTAAYVTKFDEMEKQLRKLEPEDMMIAQLQEMKKVRLMVEQNKQVTKKLESRIDSLDCSNIEGTPQQRLNAMVKKIAFDNGLTFAQAWKDFRIAFNTAYHTNLEEKRNNYLKKNSIKNLSIPEYLTRVELIKDALRIADKMLNKAS